MNTKGAKLGGVLAAIGLLSATVSAAETLDEDGSCGKAIAAMTRFLQTQDCDVLSHAQNDVDACFLAIGVDVGGVLGGQIGCGTPKSWQDLADMCQEQRRKCENEKKGDGKEK